MPTLLPLAGVKDPAADYSSGQGLFDAEYRELSEKAAEYSPLILRFQKEARRFSK